MKTSAAGRALITQREGRKLTAYRDTKGIWTIGVGHVDMTPPKVTPGMTITEAQCDAMLAADLGQVEGVINGYVKVPISQNEFDAMASLGFNIGATGLRNSTVIRKLNAGDIAGSADAFLMWTKPAVLVGRRKAERLQFLEPDAATASARATNLAVKATTKKIQAKAASSAAGAAVVASGVVVTTAATVAPHAHHIFGWLMAGGGLLAAGAVIAGIVSAATHGAATTLAANAGHQSNIAQGLGKAPVGSA